MVGNEPDIEHAARSFGDPTAKSYIPDPICREFGYLAR